MMDAVYTVSGLTGELHSALEKHFPFVWVRGEVTNISRAASGHIYFSLKDALSQLQCVWFRGMQGGAADRFDPLTGEVYADDRPPARDLLQNGQEFLCAGTIGIYASRGQYQLVVEFLQPAGAGLLALEFEKRKQKLADLGYFETARKKNLPLDPGRIALITSPHGAAIHDFLELSKSRGQTSRIRLFPVPVQGEGAAEKIARAIQIVNQQAWADVIVLIRGGGSLEDLWCFNEESVAAAIFNSSIPVLAGIGHETDVTFADMTADKRAATPSHAAQLLWRPRNEIWQKLDDLNLGLAKNLDHLLGGLQNSLVNLQKNLSLLAPQKKLDFRLLNLNEYERRMQTALENICMLKAQRLDHISQSLLAPNRLDRKFMAAREKLMGLHKSLAAAFRRNIDSSAARQALLSQNLDYRIHNFLDLLSARLREMDALLKTGDPAAPLQKGYAFLHDGKKIIGSISQCPPGSQIQARLIDGRLSLKVENSQKAGAPGLPD